MLKHYLESQNILNSSLRPNYKTCLEHSLEPIGMLKCHLGSQNVLSAIFRATTRNYVPPVDAKIKYKVPSWEPKCNAVLEEKCTLE